MKIVEIVPFCRNKTRSNIGCNNIYDKKKSIKQVAFSSNQNECNKSKKVIYTKKNKLNFLFWFQTVWFNLTKKKVQKGLTWQNVQKICKCYFAIPQLLYVIYSVKRSYLIHTSSTITKKCCYWIWLDKKSLQFFFDCNNNILNTCVESR